MPVVVSHGPDARAALCALQLKEPSHKKLQSEEKPSSSRALDRKRSVLQRHHVSELREHGGRPSPPEKLDLDAGF